MWRNRSWKTVIVFLGSMLILGSPYLVAEVNKSVKNVGSEMIMCEGMLMILLLLFVS